ncbi:MAG: hypothetical protein Q8O56_13895 [Solirubrobacteraceae bacterium]|nr:hypothetical protein [Solirubrobacteraceae bacterium]
MSRKHDLAAEREQQRLAIVAEEAREQQIRESVDQALDQLRAYVAASSPTQAQTVAVVRLLCRVVIRLARLQLGKLDGTD